MTVSISLTRTEQINGNGSSLNSTRTYSYEGNPRVAVTIPDSSTDKHVLLAVTVAQVKLIAMFATGALTVQAITTGDVNEGTAITLSSTKSFIWGYDDGTACPWANDIIYLHVTNASGAAVDLTVEILQDATP